MKLQLSSENDVRVYLHREEFMILGRFNCGISMWQYMLTDLNISSQKE